MSLARSTSASLAAVLLAVAVLAVTPRQAAGADRDDAAAARMEAAADEISSLIERVEPEDEAALSVRLAGLPGEVRPALVRVLRQAAASPTGKARRVLDLVFDRMGDSVLRALLRDATQGDADELDRVLALWLVRERRLTGSTGLVLDTVSSAETALRQGPALQNALRGALEILVANDPSCPGELASRFAALPPDMQRDVLVAADGGGRRLGSRWTGALLWPSGPHEALVLARLAALPVVDAEPLEQTAMRQLASQLESDEPELRRLAAVCVGRYHMQDAAARLVTLLTDDDAQVARAAHAALQRMTSARLPARAGEWTEFLAREREWIDADARGRFDALAAADDDSTLEALRAVARHRLHRAALSGPVTGLLQVRSVAVRRAACETLGRLGAPSALDHLVVALRDEDPGTVSAASLALARITGLAEPSMPATWRSLLGLQTAR